MQHNSLTNTVSEIQISYHPAIAAKDRISVTGAQKTYEIFMNHWNQDTILLQEEFKVMMLDASMRVIGIINHSMGTMTGTSADFRLILATALKSAAIRIIVAHNHPSGNLLPSHQDQKLTHRLKAACELLDLQLEDHLIITDHSYFSMRNEGCF